MIDMDATSTSLAAFGSATAALPSGASAWDTVGCYTALDGTPIGPIQLADLTAQHYIYKNSTVGIEKPPSTDYRNLQERTVALHAASGLAPVAPGPHHVSLYCAVTYGTDSVDIGGAQVQAIASTTQVVQTGDPLFVANQTRMYGAGYFEVGRTTLNQPETGPLVAYGSTTVSLPGPDRWDLIACHLTLDGGGFGYDQSTWLTSQHLSTDWGTDQPVYLSNRSITAVAAAPSVAAGQHRIGLVCAVPSGVDQVWVGGTGMAAVHTPVAGGAWTEGLYGAFGGSAFRTLASARFTVPPSGGSVAVTGAVSGQLNGGNQWDTVACRTLLDGSQAPSSSNAASATGVTWWPPSIRR